MPDSKNTTQPPAAEPTKPDLRLARSAWVELGKALDTADFSPPEARHWMGRAADAMNVLAGALGFHKPDHVPTASPQSAAVESARAAIEHPSEASPNSGAARKNVDEDNGSHHWDLKSSRTPCGHFVTDETSYATPNNKGITCSACRAIAGLPITIEQAAIAYANDHVPGDAKDRTDNEQTLANGLRRGFADGARYASGREGVSWSWSSKNPDVASAAAAFAAMTTAAGAGGASPGVLEDAFRCGTEWQESRRSAKAAAIATPSAIRAALDETQTGKLLRDAIDQLITERVEHVAELARIAGGATPAQVTDDSLVAQLSRSWTANGKLRSDNLLLAREVATLRSELEAIGAHPELPTASYDYAERIVPETEHETDSGEPTRDAARFDEIREAYVAGARWQAKTMRPCAPSESESVVERARAWAVSELAMRKARSNERTCEDEVKAASSAAIRQGMAQKGPTDDELTAKRRLDNAQFWLSTCASQEHEAHAALLAAARAALAATPPTSATRESTPTSGARIYKTAEHGACENCGRLESRHYGGAIKRCNPIEDLGINVGQPPAKPTTQGED